MSTKKQTPLSKKASAKTLPKTSPRISPSETIEKDQDDLMSTLESIRGLLEQSEDKLNAARESISIANANTRHDTSALHSFRHNDSSDEIVPILDEIIDLDYSSDSLEEIPELDTTFTPTAEALSVQESSLKTKPLDTKPSGNHNKTENIATLTRKNLLIDALDNLQLDLEQSLRETLMKTMVTLEKDLKDRIHDRIKQIKAEILK